MLLVATGYMTDQEITILQHLDRMFEEKDRRDAVRQRAIDEHFAAESAAHARVETELKAQAETQQRFGERLGAIEQTIAAKSALGLTLRSWLMIGLAALALFPGLGGLYIGWQANRKADATCDTRKERLDKAYYEDHALTKAEYDDQVTRLQEDDCT